MEMLRHGTRTNEAATLELHGIAWTCMELHGIAWNCIVHAGNSEDFEIIQLLCLPPSFQFRFNNSVFNCWEINQIIFIA